MENWWKRSWLYHYHFSKHEQDMKVLVSCTEVYGVLLVQGATCTGLEFSLGLKGLNINYRGVSSLVMLNQGCLLPYGVRGLVCRLGMG